MNLLHHAAATMASKKFLHGLYQPRSIPIMWQKTASLNQIRESRHLSLKSGYPRHDYEDTVQTSRVQVAPRRSLFKNERTFNAVDSTVDFGKIRSPLVVAVKRPTDYVKLQDDYNLRGKANHALVINITEFHDLLYDRHGAEHDSVYMYDLWTQLDFNVTESFGKVTKDGLMRDLNKFRNILTNEKECSCIIYIGSHGCVEGTGSHKLLTSDMMLVDLYRDIMPMFNSDICPSLKGMPRIFLVSACQIFTDTPNQRTEKNDGPLINPMDDTIVCFSSTPGYYSYRNTFLGTWFTYCLAKEFMENAYRLDIHSLLKGTQDIMRNITPISSTTKGQMCAIMDLGMKRLYFYIKNPTGAVYLLKPCCDSSRNLDAEFEETVMWIMCFCSVCIALYFHIQVRILVRQRENDYLKLQAEFPSLNAILFPTIDQK